MASETERRIVVKHLQDVTRAHMFSRRDHAKTMSQAMYFPITTSYLVLYFRHLAMYHWLLCCSNITQRRPGPRLAQTPSSAMCIAQHGSDVELSYQL